LTVRALHGLGVLVTRPEHQATPLCELLVSAGATVLRLPAITIEPAPDLEPLLARLAALDAFEFIVFTSANAVRYGAFVLERSPPPLLAAIGPATARALEASGHCVTIVPAAGFDSESLLREPRLAQLRGRRVLLVKGEFGREHLQERLIERGASVTVADVYRRVPAHPDTAALTALQASMAAGAIAIVTATSAEIAASLLAMATPALRGAFERIHWLVPGARVAAAVRAAGVTAPFIQADSAEDQDLVSAIVRWRAGPSGA